MSEIIDKQKILIVDDVADNRQMLNDLLKQDYTILLAKNGEQALDRAKQHLPDLILLDVVMPGMTGYEVMSCLQRDERTASVPVIFITGLDSVDDEAKGLLHGAIDYIAKPFNGSVVQARVAAQMKIAQQHRMLEKMANSDSLTALPNNQHFGSILSDLWNNAQMSGHSLAVGVLTIDHFKQLNQQFSYAAGDTALNLLSNMLVDHLKAVCGHVARSGEDEFTYVLPSTDLSTAFEFGQAIQTAAANLRVDHQEIKTSVTVSIGIGLSNDEGVESTESLIEKAKGQLRLAKQAGGNCVL